MSLVSSQSVDQLQEWILRNDGVISPKVVFHPSPECHDTLGCFASSDLSPHDLLFSISLSCILSIHHAFESPLKELVIQSANAIGQPEYATIEFILWLFMIYEKTHRGHFAPYLASLANTSPCPFEWSDDLLTVLEGTNLASACKDDVLQPHLAVLQHLNETHPLQFPPNEFHLKSLKWAKGHYISRRYPNKYSLGKDVDHSEFTREQGLDEVGALIPVLDLLNHKSGEQRLDFEVADGIFHVRTHIPIKKVSESLMNTPVMTSSRGRRSSLTTASSVMRGCYSHTDIRFKIIHATHML